VELTMVIAGMGCFITGYVVCYLIGMNDLRNRKKELKFLCEVYKDATIYRMGKIPPKE
jgi:1,4-dihydroxy-2-naphthoyl-CoA synthase